MRMVTFPKAAVRKRSEVRIVDSPMLFTLSSWPGAPSSSEHLRHMDDDLVIEWSYDHDWVLWCWRSSPHQNWEREHVDKEKTELGENSKIEKFSPLSCIYPSSVPSVDRVATVNNHHKMSNKKERANIFWLFMNWTTCKLVRSRLSRPPYPAENSVRFLLHRSSHPGKLKKIHCLSFCLFVLPFRRL